MKKSRTFSHDTTERKCETVYTPPGTRTPNLLIKRKSTSLRYVPTRRKTERSPVAHPDTYRPNPEKSRTFSHDMVAA